MLWLNQSYEIYQLSFPKGPCASAPADAFFILKNNSPYVLEFSFICGI